MRPTLYLLTLTSAIAAFGCGTQSITREPDVSSPSLSEKPGVRQPVLVELFTSEGCSSCPPADKNLAFLQGQQPVANAEIITLAFHVDYWDRLGWKDRFSSPLYSRRQEAYARALRLDSNYTPQMIIDGQTQFVGSDSGRAVQEIQKAAGTQKAKIDIARAADGLNVRISEVGSHDEATIFAAVVEDAASTRVERGENSGKTLEHVSVVRELLTLGTLTAGDGVFNAPLRVQQPSDSRTGGVKVVVFIQENRTLRILGVQRDSFDSARPAS